MTLTQIVTWLRQPTSVAGISALLAVATGMASHQLTLAQGLPVLIGAVVSIVLPDNTAMKTDAIALSQDLIAALNAKGNTQK
jgi:hypothetical protein